MLRKWLPGLLLLGLPLFAFGQSGSNPFDFIPRLEETRSDDPVQPKAAKQSDTISSNPFDIIRQPVSNRTTTTTTYVTDPKVDPIITTGFERFTFFATVIILALLAMVVSLVRSSLQKVIQGFINDNLFSQYYREREGRGALPYHLLYTLFFINLGLFLVYLINYYEIDLEMPYFLQWLLFSAGVGILFMGKHLLLLILGSVFPIQKEIRKYIFLIINFSIILGLLLIPADLVMAYGPEGSSLIVLYSTFGAAGLIYLFRHLRGLLIANKFIALHKFHFLLYICTVEIAPLVIIVRLILNQL